MSFGNISSAVGGTNTLELVEGYLLGNKNIVADKLSHPDQVILIEWLLFVESLMTFVNSGNG